MLPASGLRLLYASRGSGTHRSSLLFLVRRLCLYPLQRGHDHEYTAADHRNLHRSSLSLRLNKGGRPPAPAFACQKVALPPFRRSCGLLRALAVRLRRTSGTLTGQEAFAPTHMSPEQTDWTGFAPVPQGHFRACSAGLGTGAKRCEACSTRWAGISRFSRRAQPCYARSRSVTRTVSPGFLPSLARISFRTPTMCAGVPMRTRLPS